MKGTLVYDMKMNSNVERLIGTLPKVGIRPTVDGRRRGVREELEPVCMGMAYAAAELISQNLKYPNGMPVDRKSVV